MTWLDKLTSIPTLGLMHQARWHTAASLPALLGELLDKWVKTNRNGSILPPPNSFTSIIDVDDVRVTLAPDNLVFQYVNRVAIAGSAGALKLTESVRDTPLTFTERVASIRELMLEIVPYVYREEPLAIARAGLHVSCAAEQAAFPPGVQLYFEHLGRPWGGREALLDVQSTVVARLGTSPGLRDQCFHIVKRMPDGKAVELALDWQRIYDPPSERSGTTVLRESLADWIQQATAYFERFGEGNLNYADDGRSSAQDRPAPSLRSADNAG